jgi:hypothetical protein
MALGEAIRQDFTILRDNPDISTGAVSVLESSVDDCCFVLPVLAKASGGDNLTDDKSSVLFFYNVGITTALLTLQKWNGNIFADISTLTDNTYGSNYPFAFETNENNENLQGYILDWQKIIVLNGAGTYRVKSDSTTILAGANEQFSMEYCLKEYTDFRADLTTRIEWFNSGIIGSEKDDTKTRDYGSIDWFNQVRLPETIFGDDSNDYSREFVRYQNGEQVWLQDDNVESYNLKTGRFPSFLHKYLKYDMMQGDNIKVTNYDKDAHVDHIEKQVIPSSSYEPNYIRGTKLSNVELTFEQQFQNHSKKRC